MCLNQLWWQHTHPLRQRDVRVMIGAEQGKEDEWLIACVLDIVAHVARNVSDVTRLVVERAGLAAGGEDAHAHLAGEIILQLDGGRLRMTLAYRARLDSYSLCRATRVRANIWRC